MGEKVAGHGTRDSETGIKSALVFCVVAGGGCVSGICGMKKGSNREATARKGTVAGCPADRSHRGVSALSVGQVGPTSRAGANDSPGLFRSRGTRQVKPAEGVVPGGKVRKPAEANAHPSGDRLACISPSQRRYKSGAGSFGISEYTV
jgi:hypothetical protein